MPENNEKSRIIPDISIKEKSEDQFGHHTYVNWLISRLETGEDPVNIGLFGKWGVGKTGILQMFENEINENYSDKLQYIYIDCWKLTPQSLREQLLITIDKKFGGKNESEINNRLYRITTKTSSMLKNEPLKEKISRLGRISRPYLVLAGISFTVGFFIVISNCSLKD